MSNTMKALPPLRLTCSVQGTLKKVACPMKPTTYQALEPSLAVVPLSERLCPQLSRGRPIALPAVLFGFPRGGPLGVTALDAAEAGPVPLALIAATVKV